MVKEDGQLYTIEGIAAGVLMIVTAYLVMSTTSVITQQDVHIIDMQLEQLGNDALAMMDTPDSLGDQSIITQAVYDTTNSTLFDQNFIVLINATTGVTTSKIEIYNYSATIFFRDGSEVKSYPFGNPSKYYRENAVNVSRWVYLPHGTNGGYLNDGNPHSVLLEVLLWRQ